ncbi:hypothetical protein NMY22_g14070 [Coprinellus aureogranulatus]|nr:hypothetical protein NMY22_g14070 [Coprinellus aureogranulatus]
MTFSDTLWQGDEYDASVSRDIGSNVLSSGSHHAQGGDRVIYTEKITKEFDAHGNVVSQNIEHPKPGAIDALDDVHAGRSGLTGAVGASPGAGTRGRQAMVFDDYNHTGAGRTLGHETLGAQERTVPGTKHTLGDKLAAQGQKAMGSEATSNLNQYYGGEGTAGHYNPLK